MNALKNLQVKLAELGLEEEANSVSRIVKEAQRKAEQQFLFGEGPDEEDLKREEQIPLFFEGQLSPAPDSFKQMGIDRRLQWDREDLEKISLYDEKRKAEVKRVIDYLLSKDLSMPREEVFNYVLSKLPYSKHNEFAKGLLELYEEYPELKAKPSPYSPGQLELPGVKPVARFLPDPDMVEEEKKELMKKYRVEVSKYEEALEEFKTKKGREPYDYEKRSLPGFRYWESEEGDSRTYYHNRVPKPEDIKIDYNISPDRYKELQSQLLRAYEETESKRKALSAMVEEASEKYSVEKPVLPGEGKLESSRDYIVDLADRVYYIASEIILQSAGESLFGKTTGYDEDWTRPGIKDFFIGAQERWFENPEQLAEHLSTAPSFTKSKTSSWGAYSYNQLRTVDDWFNKKYSEFTSYDDALDRSIDSFKRGIRFLKGLRKKLDKGIEGFLKSSNLEVELVDKYYIDKIHDKYLEMASIIEKNLGESISHVRYSSNAGFVNSSWGYVRDLNAFSIAATLYGKNAQYEIIDNFISFALSLLDGVISEAREEILNPAFRLVSKNLNEEVCREVTGFELETLKSMDKNDKNLPQVGERFAQFFSAGDTNLLSAIKYPKFAITGSMGEDVSSIMKTRLGRAAVEYLTSDTGGSSYAVQMESNAYYTDAVRTGKIKIKGQDVGTVANELMKKKQVVMNKIIKSLKKRKKEFVVSGYPRVESYNRDETIEDVPSHYHELSELLGAGGHDLILTVLRANTRYSSDISAIIRSEARRLMIMSLDLTDHRRAAFEDAETIFEAMDVFMQVELLPETMSDNEVEAAWNDEVDKGNLIDPNSESSRNYFLDRLRETFSKNKKKNDSIREIQRLWPTASKQLKLLAYEVNYSELIDRRIRTSGGAGPRSMAKRIKNKPWLKDINVGKIIGQNDKKTAKYMNEMCESAEFFKVSHYSSGRIVESDFAESFVASLKADKVDGTSKTAYAALTIIKRLGITDVKLMEDIFGKAQKLTYEFSDFGHEEIKEFFPKIIKDYKNLDSQLAKAIKMCAFVHNRGSGLGKAFYRNMVKDPNFKDWGKVHLIDKYFEVCAKLNKLGGYKGIMRELYPTVRNLISQGLVRRGFGVRIKAVLKVCRSDIRINPSLVDFEQYKYLIDVVLDDLKKVEEFGAYAEYNEEVVPKNKNLYNINWEPKGESFRFRVLKTYDPYHFQVGSDTGCCQTLNGAGENAVLDSYVNPYAGVVILEMKKKEGGWKTASQSYFHYVPSDQGYILDNVEARSVDLSDFKSLVGFSPEKAYAAWGKYIDEKVAPGYFIMGARFTDIETDVFPKKKLNGDPRDFVYKYSYQGRTDWSPSQGLDLTNSKLDVEDLLKEKKQPKISSPIIDSRLKKLSSLLESMGLSEESRFIKSL